MDSRRGTVLFVNACGWNCPNPGKFKGVGVFDLACVLPGIRETPPIDHVNKCGGRQLCDISR